MGRDVPPRERENQAVLALVLLAVFLSGNRFIYFSIYAAAAVYMILRALYAGFRKREKAMLCIGYLVLLALQVVYAETVIFEPGNPPVLHWLLRATGVLAMALPCSWSGSSPPTRTHGSICPLWRRRRPSASRNSGSRKTIFAPLWKR